MKKKNNKNQNHMNDVIISSDELAYMTDEDIRNLQDSLRKEREYEIRDGYSAKNTEIMLCYVQRELGVREVRRAAHARYMKDNGITSDVQDVTAEAVETNDSSRVVH